MYIIIILLFVSNIIYNLIIWKKPLVGDRLPLVGGQLTQSGGQLPLVGGQLPLVGGQLPLVGGQLPLVGGQLTQSGGDVNFKTNKFNFDLKDKDLEKYKPQRFHKNKYHSRSKKVEKPAEIEPPIFYTEKDYAEYKSNNNMYNYLENELLYDMLPKSSHTYVT